MENKPFSSPSVDDQTRGEHAPRAGQGLERAGPGDGEGAVPAPAISWFTSPYQAWSALPATVRGALWMLAASLGFVMMQTLVKFLGNELHSFQVSFFRAFLGFVFILPIALRGRGLAGLKTKRPMLHISRGIMGTGGMICGFYAFTHMPLADATALTFSRALFVVPLAILFLSETVGIRRALATIVGFIGVLIVLRPTGAMEPAALVAVFSAFCVAGALIHVKILSATESATTLLLYSGLVGTVMTVIPAAAVWIQPTWSQFALLIVMGIVGLMSHNCMVRAYAMADATALAPLDYTRLIFAAIFGFFLFAELPDGWTILGALIIAGSTLYITLREARIARKAKEVS